VRWQSRSVRKLKSVTIFANINTAIYNLHSIPIHHLFQQLLPSWAPACRYKRCSCTRGFWLTQKFSNFYMNEFSITSAVSLSTLRRRLKTHLFTKSFLDSDCFLVTNSSLLDLAVIFTTLASLKILSDWFWLTDCLQCVQLSCQLRFYFITL